MAGFNKEKAARALPKTKEDLWADRISSLPEEKQKQISKKYYGGATPWKKEGKKNV